MTLLVFFLFCLISVLVGAGALYAIGFKDPNDPILISSPFIALCVWAVILGFGVSLKVPVRTLTYIIWGINLILCLVAFKFFRFKKFFPLFISCVGFSLFVSYPNVVHGFSEYAGGPSPDGWSYIAFGQYLWEYPICMEGGLAPLYQYSAHLCQTRFVASSLLGLISPLTGTQVASDIFHPLTGSAGDTQTASGYFLPWSFFVYASACVYFIYKRTISPYVWGYIFLCLVSGWSFYIVIYNNFDQALSLGSLPAIAGMVGSVKFSENRWALLMALVLSSVFYIYPEMSPIIFAGCFLLLVYHLFISRTRFLPLLRLGGFFILAFGLMVSVYSRTWFGFLQAQLSISQATVRPGGTIASELISKGYWLAGLWGLAGVSDRFIILLNACALILSILAIIGLIIMVKNKDWGLVAVHLFLAALVAYFIVIQKYGYGAYKLITLLWWLVSYTIILSVEWLWTQDRIRPLMISVRGMLAFVVIMVAGVNLARLIRFDENLVNVDIAPYRDLQSLDQIIFNSPVGISVTDPTANLWAMYFLRDSLTHFYSYQSYPNQPHVLPYMDRSQGVDNSTIQYLLTDAGNTVALEGAEVVWRNPVYALLRIEDASSDDENSKSLSIVVIDNPNGLETVNGDLFFWMGNQPTKISLFTAYAGQVKITGDFIPGPSLPNSPDRRVSVQTDAGYLTEVNVIETPSFLIPVRQGVNVITIHPLDEATLLEQPNGDKRILLIGVSDLKAVYQANKP